MYSRTIRAAAAAATLALAVTAPGADAARKKPLTRSQVQKMIDAAVMKALKAGPAGAQGAAGATGAPGTAGATGPTGPKGEKGDQGEKGEPGTSTLTGPAGGVLTGAFPNPGLAEDVIQSRHVAPASINGSDVQEFSLTGSDLAGNSIRADHIVNGSIDIFDIKGPPGWTPLPVIGPGWSNTAAGFYPAPGTLASAVSTYRDHLGRVWFRGTAERTSGHQTLIGCADTLTQGSVHKGIFSVPTGDNVDIMGAVQAFTHEGKLCLALAHGSPDQVFLDGISIRE